MSIKTTLKKTKLFSIRRNNICFGGTKALRNQVNLEYWHAKTNIGDTLSPVVVNWMLQRNNLSLDTPVKHTSHLLAIGSIIGMGDFDSTIWGSGVHTEKNIQNINRQAAYRKYDIRLVRGPKTRAALLNAGYTVPENYGDPAVIMPHIYQSHSTKEYDCSIILHLSNSNLDTKELHTIDVQTDDYRFFVDEICKSKKVISSSLHGIILSEVYGVPCIFLNQGMDKELMKFTDWYASTGRSEYRYANTIEEALDMEPMELPDFSQMQDTIINTFPYDLWK